MKDILFINPKIEVRKSTIHGYGVFANDFIKKDELLEECHWVRIPKYVPDVNCMSKEDSNFIVEYQFSWPKFSDKRAKHFLTTDAWVGAFALGFGQLYNSIDHYSGNIDNANWTTNLETNLFEFWAVIDIHKDEEILINYSGTILNHMRAGILKRERTKPKIFKK